jgi:phosphoserine phosphatase RsbU/P
VLFSKRKFPPEKMKNQTLRYILLALLFVFSLAALAAHYGNISDRLRLDPDPYRMPFYYTGGAVNLSEEARRAGIRVGDRVTALNGTPVEKPEDFFAFSKRLNSTDPVTVTLERKSGTGGTFTKEVSVEPIKFTASWSYFGGILVNFLFIFFFPTFSILLGFWVVLMRPNDYLAWLLLFILCGTSSIGLEGYPPGTLVGTYRSVFFNFFALAMLLFGIYFPERWTVDRRFPWAKWILIVPLVFQTLIVLLAQLRTFFGLNLIDYLAPAVGFYERYIASFANMMAIGIFFAALSHKAFTIKNPDSRRRLKLMAFGTTLAMTPTFLITLYTIATGARGSFFDIVPGWLAVAALLMVLLFPLTLAYVIVAQRAMNVGVVVRQGLQYALAKNGIRVLQFLLFIAVIFGTFMVARAEENVSAQFAFIVGGLMLIPLIDYTSKNLRVWIDRKFFREAYDAEQILTDLSEQVRTMVETKPLLETVSERISKSLHVPQVALLLKNGAAFRPAYWLGYETVPPVELSETGKTIEKLKQNEALTIYGDEKDSWIDDGIESGERGNLKHLNTQLLLPIAAKDGLSGVISLSPKLSEEPFTPSDLRLLKSVASQTGLALENSRLTEAIAREAAQKERLNRELEIAREVQERLFPQNLPEIDGLDYYGACRPALGVGGDYYDFLEFESGKFGLAIGDISGKGIGASLMMASLQASLRGQCPHFKDDLAGLLKRLNSLLYEASTSNRYATFFYAQYEPQTKNLIYVNAGHNPPFLIRRTGEVIKLEAGGPVVGMLPSDFVSYEQGEITLAAGDLLVGFTDGISEAMNLNEDEWGEEAMLEELKKVRAEPSAEILEYIVERADEFAGGAKQHDDMTMIVIKMISAGG